MPGPGPDLLGLQLNLPLPNLVKFEMPVPEKIRADTQYGGCMPDRKNPPVSILTVMVTILVASSIHASRQDNEFCVMCTGTMGWAYC